jgi:D-xylose transport system permease protein
MTDRQVPAAAATGSSIGNKLRSMELDLRLIGMIGALIVIWIAFHIGSDGRFITPRNLFNLSVQTASVAIMATGMVFVIVARHIDLSVGSLLGFIGMMMGAFQAEWITEIIGFNHPATWAITILFGLVLGFVVGALHGILIGYLGIPAFIVTLGGLLVWRGAVWMITSGRTVSPLDKNFLVFGGGVEGTLGAFWSVIFGALCLTAILFFAFNNRRQRKLFRFPLKPVWAETANIALLSMAVIGFVMTMNAYPIAPRAASRMAEARGIPVPEGGLGWVHGIAVPVVIVAVIAVVMAYVSRRTKFGRYVFAMGGNPQAAELSGINTKRMTLYIFMVMGVLTALSSVVALARLQNAVNDLGSLDELRVIAAAVIGGTSLAGGVGTIYGAILGALVMQSLQSGMGLIGVEAPLQSMVIGIVLVLAVCADQFYRRRIAN